MELFFLVLGGGCGIWTIMANKFKLDYLPSQKFYFCPGGIKCKKGNYFLTIFIEFS